MRQFRSLSSIVKYDFISTLRKKKEDWNISSVRNVVIGILLGGLYLLLMIISGGGAYLIIRLFEIKPADYFTVLLLFLSLEQVLWGLEFFKKHLKHFLLDINIFLHQIKAVRLQQVHALFFRESVKHTVIMWGGVALPMVLTLSLFFTPPAGFLRVLLGAFHYLLFSYIISSFFALFSFLGLHFFHRLLRNVISAMFILITSTVFPFTLGYGAYLAFNHFQSLIQEMKQLISPSLTQWFPYVWLFVADWKSFFFALAVALLASLLFYWLWEGMLRRLDLIAYLEISAPSASSYRNSFKESSARSAIFEKDRLYLTRVNRSFIQNMSNMLFLLMLFIGFAVPFITETFDKYPLVSFLTTATIIALLTYQFLGDGLKMIVSADAEAKNIHIFLGNVQSLWDIVAPKLRLYTFFVITISLPTILIFSFLTPFSIQVICYLVLLFFTSGLLHGIAQIASTALYPKLHWELVHEIGESGKASTYRNIYTLFLFVFYFQVVAISDFVLIRNGGAQWILWISDAIMLLVTALNYLVLKAFLQKIPLRERFVDHDSAKGN